MKAGFLPDSISTDLHISSMNAGMKDMLNVMGKFLAMGEPLKAVIAQSTWNPAREIKQDGLGHLSVGAIADIAVLRLEKGKFGYLDMHGAQARGHRATRRRDDAEGRQDRLRAERAVATRVVDAAHGLQDDRRAHLGRDEEVTWPSRRTRRRRTDASS